MEVNQFKMELINWKKTHASNISIHSQFKHCLLEKDRYVKLTNYLLVYRI